MCAGMWRAGPEAPCDSGIMLLGSWPLTDVRPLRQIR